MICNKCNHKLPDDSEFCQYCGNKIEKTITKVAETISLVEENPASTSNYENERNVRLPKEKTVKTKYCSRCGALIDNETKQCTGCGKQYFKGIRFNKFYVIITLFCTILTTSIVLNVIQLKDRNEIMNEATELRKDISDLEKRIKSKESEVSKLKRQVEEQEYLVDFIDRYVVFEVDDGTNRYHKFECYKFDPSVGFAVYNTKQANNVGLRPCSSCH